MLHALCKILSKISKQAITDYIEFILFHVKDVGDVYNVYE